MKNLSARLLKGCLKARSERRLFGGVDDTQIDMNVCRYVSFPYIAKYCIYSIMFMPSCRGC